MQPPRIASWNGGAVAYDDGLRSSPCAEEEDEGERRGQEAVVMAAGRAGVGETTRGWGDEVGGAASRSPPQNARRRACDAPRLRRAHTVSMAFACGKARELLARVFLSLGGGCMRP
jgi:hypothetical protein